LFRFSQVAAALELIKIESIGVASFNMDEKDIERFMKQRFMMTCSEKAYRDVRQSREALGAVGTLFHSMRYSAP